MLSDDDNNDIVVIDDVDYDKVDNHDDDIVTNHLSVISQIMHCHWKSKKMIKCRQQRSYNSCRFE